MTTDDMEIGARIRAARQARGLSQAQLGEAIGASPKTVSSWETARSTPATHYLRLICEALKESADWIIFGDERGIDGRCG